MLDVYSVQNSPVEGYQASLLSCGASEVVSLQTDPAHDEGQKKKEKKKKSNNSNPSLYNKIHIKSHYKFH